MNYLTPLSNTLPSLFDDIFFKNFFEEDSFFNSLPSIKKIDYPVDIQETEKGIEIDVAAIGLGKDDIKIDIKDNVIKISYDKKVKNEKKENQFLYRGITRKSFSHAYRIGDKYDLTKTEANMDKGLLSIVIPFAPEKKPKELEVKIN